MRLDTMRLDALFAPDKRQVPIRAHLQVLVQCFHRFMIERVFCAFLFLRPDYCLMSIGKAHASKVWHWIVLDPDDIVQNPESQILHDGADAKNVVISPNDPE